MSERNKNFQHFLVECEKTFKFVVGDSAVVLTNDKFIVDDGKEFVSTYHYQIHDENERPRGPYKFECRQSSGEGMHLYSEI